MNRQDLGEAGEQLARTYLARRGLKVIEANHRSRLGEIDLVCRDADTIVFIEVKTRASGRFGAPAAAVNLRKQARLRRLAEEYLIANDLESAPVRFDVLSIILAPGAAPELDYITGAF
ncbi:MAG: YraN family protein [candidate division WOR-3 bacterium]